METGFTEATSDKSWMWATTVGWTGLVMDMHEMMFVTWSGLIVTFSVLASQRRGRSIITNNGSEHESHRNKPGEHGEMVGRGPGDWDLAGIEDCTRFGAPCNWS